MSASENATPAAGPVAGAVPVLPEFVPVAPESGPAVPESGPVAAPESGFAAAPAGPEATARRLPKAVGTALAVAGLLAVTATSAAVTVAVGKPEERAAVAAGAPASPSASATATASATAAPSPTATATAVPLPSVAPAPKPTSTLKGTVKGGTHGGDLRYFLLPVPDGGETYGPADGNVVSDKELVEFYGQDDIMEVLKSYTFKESATRTYRSADGTVEVDVRLMRFGSAAMAEAFVMGEKMKREEIAIDGDPKAHGYVINPKQRAYTGSMIGFGSQGDVEYSVTVQVKGNPDKALLSELMKRQRERLASGS